MPQITDIEAATAEGEAIGTLYSQLRATKSAAERATLLRQIGEYADAIGQRLRRLAEQNAKDDPSEEVRAAMGRLSEAMEQVMVQEREYRMACGAPADNASDEPETAGP